MDFTRRLFLCLFLFSAQGLEAVQAPQPAIADDDKRWALDLKEQKKRRLRRYLILAAAAAGVSVTVVAAALFAKRNSVLRGGVSGLHSRTISDQFGFFVPAPVSGSFDARGAGASAGVVSAEDDLRSTVLFPFYKNESSFPKAYVDPLSGLGSDDVVWTDWNRRDSWRDRMMRCLVLGALGDARGNPVEFLDYRDGFFNQASRVIMEINRIVSFARERGVDPDLAPKDYRLYPNGLQKFFACDWPSITTLNDMPNIGKKWFSKWTDATTHFEGLVTGNWNINEDGECIVTDDTVMTELTIRAIMTQMEGGNIFDTTDDAERLMREVVEATFINMKEGMDCDWSRHGGLNHARFPINEELLRLREEHKGPRGYSWVSQVRGPGPACIGAMPEYDARREKDRRFWDRTLYQGRKVGEEGGCGKIMDSSSFGIMFCDDPELAGKLSAMHARISHPEVVSQAACGAYSLGIAMAIRGSDLRLTILPAMIRFAKEISAGQFSDEVSQWVRTPEYFKPGAVREREKPYTVAERIRDAINAADGGTTPDQFYREHTGKGAPDFLDSVVFTALYALRNGLTISQAINLPINSTVLTDRDSLAAGIGHFMGACHEFDSGITQEEMKLLERNDDRLRLAGECMRMKADSMSSVGVEVID